MKPDPSVSAVSLSIFNKIFRNERGSLNSVECKMLIRNRLYLLINSMKSNIVYHTLVKKISDCLFPTVCVCVYTHMQQIFTFSYPD